MHVCDLGSEASQQVRGEARRVTRVIAAIGRLKPDSTAVRGNSLRPNKYRYCNGTIRIGNQPGLLYKGLVQRMHAVWSTAFLLSQHDRPITEHVYSPEAETRQEESIQSTLHPSEV